MWSQLLLIASAFGLGYYFATRGSSVPRTATVALLNNGDDDDDDGATIAGAFPTQSKDSISGGSANGNNGNGGGLSSKKKKNKGKAKKSTKQQPLLNAESPELAPESKQPEARQGNSDVVDDDTSDHSDAAIAQANEDEEREEMADEWIAVDSMSAARPTKKAPAGIPIHASVWSSLKREEDLSQETVGPSAPARVLRIGAAARPPPAGPMRMRREYTSAEPLTKKQRQNQRKTERLREQRAYNSEVQAHRLRQHQIAQTDLRSREQWAKAKRTAAKTSLPPRSSKTLNSSASVIEGKLVWD
ncbi:hypothetical protein IWW37_002285 [Coemansia sp. RSA 2050]|nr:hypothetical protein IWW37_002285 [Coemansia sp. RSA 2050]KAJ2734523.1 hypothetical protein IW152_002301 [Coemansia sp. BCRC 34962]